MRIDRQSAFSGTTDSDLPLAILQDWLNGNIAGFTGPVAVRRFKGGQSNPTYLVETPRRRYVLRRKPSGKLLPSAHAIEREFRVTRALSGAGFPVAAPLALCMDDRVIGSAFFVMEHADGRIFWEPHAPGLAAHERAQLFDAMNETIARLHMLDPRPLGLGDFGKPEGYVTRQVARWTRQYRASETEAIAEMDDLIDWLPQAVPQQIGQRPSSMVISDSITASSMPPNPGSLRSWTGSFRRWAILSPTSPTISCSGSCRFRKVVPASARLSATNVTLEFRELTPTSGVT